MKVSLSCPFLFSSPGWIFSAALSWALVGCSSGAEKPVNSYRSAGEERPLVDAKYSLTADRKALEELRSQIPEEKKRENDELAFILQLVSGTQGDSSAVLTKSPSEIRSQFDSLLRKKREKFDKDLRTEREQVTKEERKRRESFLRTQQESRDSFSRAKHTRDEKNIFYKELDEKRSEFFSNEREKRADFESDIRERRKSFEDYAREKTNEFNQEIKAYQKRFEEDKKRRESLKSKSATPSEFRSESSDQMLSEAADLERELQEARLKRGTVLESGE